MGGFQHGVPCTWQLPWLAVEKPCSAPAWPFLSSLTETGIDKAPLPFYGFRSDTVGCFHSGEAFTGWRALTIVSLLMSRHGRGHEP